ncbi:hypothetical protein PtA15_13A505 [Puccinia triticina]|uniref:Uncharacterized protein n=1 Tax=Puccinia triticina TaxID=208348 RepID=A0ABY7D2Q9_9BASI|nr:uncharacterized protein PtA15_13A505 [Puccinia triticina]WAQ91104.1 hypothetical protein PtA15_13A505 [Puccinia triticina]WAR61297.1 hypothetical protein PtB15_13B553 [Puccinia triticina]
MASGFLPPCIIPGQEPETTAEERQEIYKYLHWTRLGQAGQDDPVRSIEQWGLGWGQYSA